MKIRRNKRTKQIVGAEITNGRDEDDDRALAQLTELLARPDAAGLRELDVVLTEGYDDALRAIATARSLTDLSLRRASTSSDGATLSILGGHPALRRLEVAPGIVDGPIALPALEELVVAPETLTHDFVRDFATWTAGMPSLRSLELHLATPPDSVDIAATLDDLVVLLGADLRLTSLALHEANFYAEPFAAALLASPLVAHLDTLTILGNGYDLREALAALPCRLVTEQSADEDREMIERILATPDAVEPFLVLADWLAERGDPRADLIHVQHALLAKPSPKLRRRERELLRRGGFLDQLPADEVSLQVTWFMGHLRTAKLSCSRDYDWLPGEILRRPVARYLRRLEVGVHGGAQVNRASLQADAPPGCEIFVFKDR